MSRRRSSRLPQVLTESSVYAGKPRNSLWMDDLDDSAMPVAQGTLVDKSRLSRNDPRRSKWWVDVDDSVHVPPQVQVDSDSGSDSPFSSGNEMSGKLPAPRRTILRGSKRKRATNDGFVGAFDPDEPPAKRKSSILKRSSAESVLDEGSPLSQPKKDGRKGALFRKEGLRKSSRDGNKSGNSKFENAFNDGADDDFQSTSRRVPRGLPESDRSASPDLRLARPPKKVLHKKKSQSRPTRPDLKQSFSDDEDEIVTEILSVSERSPSPTLKSSKGAKKVVSKNTQKTIPTSGFYKAFSKDEDENETHNSSWEEQHNSMSDRSKSPVTKSERLSKKVPTSSRKSRTSRPDLDVEISNSDDEISEKNLSHSDKSSSPPLKSGTGAKKVISRKPSQKNVTTSAFDKAFSSDGDDTEISNRPRKELQRSTSDRSQSPANKLERLSKKVATTTRKSRSTAPDLDVELTNSEDEITKRNLSGSDKTPSPILKSGKGATRVISKKSQKTVTTSAFDNAFNSDDDDNEISNSSQKVLQRFTSDRSQSPAAKLERILEDVPTSVRKSRTTRPDLNVEFNNSEDEITKKNLSGSDKTPSPTLKSGKEAKRVISKKSQKTVTTSAFDNAFDSDDDDNEISSSSQKVLQRSTSDRSQSPAAKLERILKKVPTSVRKSRTTRPDLNVEFNNSEDEITEKNLSHADKSPSPTLKSGKGAKKVISKKPSQKTVTTSAFDNAFSSDGDDTEISNRPRKELQRSTSDRSQSPATKLERLSKKVATTTRKSRTTAPDLDVELNNSEDEITEKNLSHSDKSPSPLLKSGTGAKKVISKKPSQKTVTTSAFDNAFSSDGDDTEIFNRSQKELQRSTSDRSQSPATKLKRILKKVPTSVQKSRNTRPDLNIEFNNSEDEITEKNLSHSDKSPSPPLKSGTGAKKVISKKPSQKTVTTSAFDKAFSSDGDDNEIFNRSTSQKELQRSTSDRSQSPATKLERILKKVATTTRKSQKTVNTSAFDDAFNSDDDDDILIPNLSQKVLQSSTSDRSQNPAAKSERLSKKVATSMKKSRSTGPGSDVELNSSDEVTEKLLPGSERSPSPDLNSGSRAKKVLSTRKSGTTRPILDVNYGAEEGSFRSHEKSKNSSFTDQSPILSRKMRNMSKGVLHKKQKSAVKSAFDQISVSSDDAVETMQSTREISPRLSVSGRNKSPAVDASKFVQISYSKKSGARSDIDNTFDNSQNPTGLNTRGVSERLSATATKSEKEISLGLQKETRRSAGGRNESFGATSPEKQRKWSSDVDDSNHSAPSRSDGPDENIRKIRKTALFHSKPGRAKPSLNEVTESDDNKDEQTIALDAGSVAQHNRTIFSNHSKRDVSHQKPGGIDDLIKLSATVRSESPAVNTSRHANKVFSTKMSRSTASGFDKVFNSDINVNIASNTDSDSTILSTIRSASPVTEPASKTQKNLRRKKAEASGSEYSKASKSNENSNGHVVVADLGSLSHSSSLSSVSSNRSEFVSAKKTRSMKPAVGDVANNEHNAEGIPKNIRKRSTRSSTHNVSGDLKKLTESSVTIRPEMGNEDDETGHAHGSSGLIEDSNLPSSVKTQLSGSMMKKDAMSRSRIVFATDPDNLIVSESPRKNDEGLASRTSFARSLERSRGLIKDADTTSRSRIVFATDPDNLIVSESPRKNDEGLASRTSFARSLDRSRNSIKVAGANTSPRSADRREIPPTVPVTPATLLFAHEANFTNFNPQANSTKVLQVSKSLVSEASPMASPWKASRTSERQGGNESSRSARGLEAAAADEAAAAPPKAKGAANLPSRQDDIADCDVSVIGSWSGAESTRNVTVSDTTPASSRDVTPEVSAPKKSLPPPVMQMPPQVPIPIAIVEKYTPEEAAARRKEYFATLLERAKKSFPELVVGAPKKQKTMTDFYPKAVAPPTVRKEPKPVDPSLLVNGKRWRPPKLARPAPWCTDRLYTHVQKQTEKLYGEFKKRRKSEDFIVDLAFNVKKAIRCKNNCEPYVLRVVYLLNRLGLIETMMDFYVFVENYLPEDFSYVAVPKARGFGATTGLRCFFDINVKKPIDFKDFPPFEK